MKFGVIQCSRCKTARGIVMGSKNAQCPRCGKTMDIKRTRIIANVDSERELTAEVARLNVAISEGEEIYAMDVGAASDNRVTSSESEETEDVYDVIAGGLAKVNGRDAKIVAAARELDRRLGQFTEEEFCDVLGRAGLSGDDECEGYIKKLKEGDVIFEPRSGVFRCIENDL